MQKRSAFREIIDGPLSAIALVGGLLAVGWGVATIPQSLARMRAAQSADGVVTEDLLDLYPGQTYGFGIGTPIFVMGLLSFVAAHRRERAQAVGDTDVSRAARV